MPSIILKIPHIKASSKAVGWVRYIATRDGVDKTINENIVVGKPTKKQIEYIDEILKLCPDVKNTFEYQDYIENPTIQNASAFISVAAESNFEITENRETYLKYIATRPRVEKKGSHGLFGNEDTVDIAKVKKEIAENNGVLWMPIISLKREDADRLGYNSADTWRALFRAKQMEIAEIYGIPIKDFRWYAAFHNEGHHPHCHMVIYSENSRRGFIDTKDIENIKSLLAKEIFKNDLYELYDAKTKHREKISEDSKNRIRELINKIREKDCNDLPICNMIITLSVKLQDAKGKKKYGYLSKSLKKEVDEIVRVIAEDKDIHKLYSEWCDIQRKIVGIYNDRDIEFPLLWENDEFKKIKNAVIDEAVKLGGDRTFFIDNESVSNEKLFDEEQRKNYELVYCREDLHPMVAESVLNLFCRIANMIDDDANKKIDGHIKSIVDSKERKEIARKKQRLGIKME